MFILMAFLLGGCGESTKAAAIPTPPPREWPLAAINGIHPKSFALDGQMIENEPKLVPGSVLNFIPHPHGSSKKLDYDRAEIYYEGNGRIGEVRFRDSFILGFPIAAFSYEGERFLLSQFPYVDSPYVEGVRKGNRLVHDFHLYILRDGCLRELTCHTRWGPGPRHEPRTLQWKRNASLLADRALWLDVVSRLRFTEPQLNGFAASWRYWATEACIELQDDAEQERRLQLEKSFDSFSAWHESDACRKLKEQDAEEAIRHMDSFVASLESDMATHPAMFAPDLPALVRQGYLAAPRNTPAPEFIPFRAFFRHPHDEEPRMQELHNRFRLCLLQLLEKADKGEIRMTPECIEMYQERVHALEEAIRRGRPQD